MNVTTIPKCEPGSQRDLLYSILAVGAGVSNPSVTPLPKCQGASVKDLLYSIFLNGQSAPGIGFADLIGAPADNAALLAALSTASITGGTIAGLTVFGLRDTSAAYDVSLIATSTIALTGARSITLDVNNASQVLKFAGASTITFPSGTVTLAKLSANTFTGQQIISLNGAASTPPLTLTGTIFTGGSATTTKPQFLIEPSGTTSTNWNTNGTLLGLNASSGFTGNALDVQLNGVRKFRIDYRGYNFLPTSAHQNDPAWQDGDGMGFSFRGSNNNTMGVVGSGGIMAAWTGDLVMLSSTKLSWSSTTRGSGWPAASDVGLLRRSSGVLEVNTGTSGTIATLWTKLPTTNPGPGILWNNAGTPAIGT